MIIVEKGFIAVMKNEEIYFLIKYPAFTLADEEISYFNFCGKEKSMIDDLNVSDELKLKFNMLEYDDDTFFDVMHDLDLDDSVKFGELEIFCVRMILEAG